jgi:hypothetical protein
LKIIDFIESTSFQINCKHVWKFDQTQNALLNSSFFILPTQVIIKIFGFISIDDRRNISLVCRYFKMIVDKDNIWNSKSYTYFIYLNYLKC